MAEIIRMPEVLAGAAEAAIQTWLVQLGTAVAVDQTLAEIETEKAVVEFQAETSGVVGRLLAAEGDTVVVGEPILVLVAAGEGDDAIDAALTAAGVRVAAGATATEPEPEPVTVAAETPAAAEPVPSLPSDDAGAGRRLFASPLVRRLAAQNGVELSSVAGTGPNGRIVRRDLERYVTAAPQPAAAPTALPVLQAAVATTAPKAPTDFVDIPLDRMRKAIARRLTESKSTVPHFYLVADCRVDALLSLRGQVNESAQRKISVNDFVLKAVATALVEVSVANAIWNGDSIRQFSSVDISVAVATDGGLTTPVLRGVERMPLSEVSATVAELAERARSGRLKQNELEGGSFAVSNLGMYGTTQFSAILNPPQSGILAVGAAHKIPIVGEDGELRIGSIMTMTLSADHRVLDGAVAAQWLAAFQRLIENPLTILI